MINIGIVIENNTGAITLREDALGVMLNFAIDEDDIQEAVAAAIGQAFTQLAAIKADPPSTTTTPRPTTKPAAKPTTVQAGKKPTDKKPTAEPAIDTANLFTF